MKTIKSIFVTKCVLLISAIIVVTSLICYAALSQANHDDSRRDAVASPATQIPDSGREALENENNPDFVKQRREWIDRFLGLGPALSPEAYAKALAEARAVPLAPLVQTWTFQALSPMENNYGGGASARTDAIAVDPTNADIVYVGSEGGLSKSTDGGENWTNLLGNLYWQSISSIAIDPVAPNIIYAGTGTNTRFGTGIYRSTDSGATWSQVLGVSQFTGKTVRRIAIDPRTAGSATTTTLYASVTGSGTHSAWKSTNSGVTWTLIRSATGAGGGVTLYDIAIDPSNSPSTIYVAAPDGLFTSANGFSASIHPRGTPPCPSAPACLAFVNSTLYIAFRECPGGNPCSPQCTPRTTIARSTNGGSSWNDLPQPCAATTPFPCADLGAFGVDPAHPGRIFVGGGGLLVYSLDGGITWGHNSCEPGTTCVHPDIHSLAFCPTNSQRNFLGTDGGIYRADYGGSGAMNWLDKNQNLAGSLMYGLSISSDDHIVMGNQDNGTQLGWLGRNPPWRLIFGGDGFKPRIDQNNSSKFYFTQYGCVVSPDWGAPYRTTDGGTTSVPVTPHGAFGERSSFFPAMFVTSGNSARVIMGFRNIWRSTDSGDSWTRIGGTPCATPSPTPSCDFALQTDCGVEPSPTPGTATAVYEAPSNTNVIYAVFDSSRLWVTQNANAGIPPGVDATWTNRTNSLPGGIQAVTIDPVNPQIAYVACNSANSGLYKTTNMGMTWTQLGTQISLPYLGCWDLAIDPANASHIFVATGAGVYASTDAGTTWGGYDGGIPIGMAVTSLSFNATSRQLAASTYGRGAYVLDLDDVPPTVQITSPVNGATVSGNVTVSANASDNHRIVGVQFKLNGANLGNEDTSPPYSIQWSIPITDCGSRTLTAVARDPAGNTRTSNPVTVTANRPCGG
jgi:photosystem II stability/assembly factor-like uncharacterized protein